MKLSEQIHLIEPFAAGYLAATDYDDVGYRIGCGLLNQARYLPITLGDSAFFAGEYDFDLCGVQSHYAHSVWVNEGVLDREIECFPALAEELRYVKEYFSPLDGRRAVREAKSPIESSLTAMRACWGGDWGGHGNPDYGSFLRLGTAGIIARIEQALGEHPERRGFYLGLIRSMQALETLARRYAMLAQKKALYAEGEEKTRLLRIARALSHCPEHPPRDFFEACQSFWLCFMYMGADSPGRFDQFMIPYYRLSSPSDAEECMRQLWEEFRRTRTWNLCIGGSDGSGRDQTNELSYLILRLAREYKYNTPNLTMRVHKGTPASLLDEAIETIASGIGMPVLYNDECVSPALEAIGIPTEDARDYCMNGCNQIDVMGKSHMGLEDGEVSLLKALELTIFGGVCGISGKRIGIDCGDVCSIGSYEDFFAAYLRQLDYLTDCAVKMANDAQRIYASIAPNPLRSALIQGCIESGRDYKNGGPLYNHGQILAEGIADTADSLAAIRYFIFDTKRYSMRELKEALSVSFRGFEEMHRDLTGFKKFGNDDPYVDGICAETVGHFFRYLQTKRTFRGGVYTGGCSPFNRAAMYGECVGAMPNGRCTGDSLLADSIGAVPGEDVKGSTALLLSVLKLPHALAGSGFVLNLKLDRALFASEERRRAVKSLFLAYFAGGGQQISPSVISRAELEDALVHPERHKDLIVRVGGYSDYFNRLSDGLKQNVIRRTVANLP